MAEENSGVTLYQFNPIRIINEVKKRPALYRLECNVDRDEKLSLWKEIGSALFHDWDSCNKAQKYDRVLQLQKKWRSLRDAYNRELRCRRSGVRVNRRVYRYFKKLSFLGGFEGSVSGSDNDDIDDEEDVQVQNAVVIKKEKTARRRKVREESRDSTPPAEEFEMPIFPIDVANDESDGDKLFLLSFLPELRQLPSHIKMWARAQIANVMQEALCQALDDPPGSVHFFCMEGTNYVLSCIPDNVYAKFHDDRFRGLKRSRVAYIVFEKHEYDEATLPDRRPQWRRDVRWAVSQRTRAGYVATPHLRHSVLVDAGGEIARANARMESNMSYCLDVELFIKEVQKHPEIWDFNNEDHRFKNRKQEAWEQISNIFITDFEYLPEEEKIDVYRKLHGKWRNIRDSFVRHLRKGDRKKSYMYAKHLQFLNQVYNSKSGNVDNDGDDDDDDDDGSNTTWQSDSDDVKLKNSVKKRKIPILNTSNILLDENDSVSTIDNFKRRRKETEVCKKENTIEFVDTPFAEAKCSYPSYSVEDEDRAFFESLLPAVRQFDLDQKLEFRSQVICFIKSIRADRSFE